ncbi:hypothetical protein FRC19_002135 [Serendipita sp. 401]|nr:hypothetical protein FRC19_002135 [Serendipita sp. 401]
MSSSSSMKTLLVSLAAASSSFLLVNAQDGFTPLASQSFTYSNLPYQADPNTGERGRQYGYNICNSTTENQESLCQTSIINAIDGELPIPLLHALFSRPRRRPQHARIFLVAPHDLAATLLAYVTPQI